MKTKEVKRLLQRYFNGESSHQEEQALENYFRSGKVAEELKYYKSFFVGISELQEIGKDDPHIEEEVMDFILEQESGEKSKYRRLWTTVTGIAASIILVVGGMLFYQQQDQQFEDTFENPEVAYNYASHTLQYVSAKYNKGLRELQNFDKLETASKPLKKGVKPVNAVFENLKKVNSKETGKKSEPDNNE